jgi:hypothetical protein
LSINYANKQEKKESSNSKTFLDTFGMRIEVLKKQLKGK